MVSVAMATYNGQKYIREQLDSIMQQTVLPDEIIVRDDGSSDNTIGIIKEYEELYEDIRWDVQVNETNIGFVANFMGAIKACKEEIIVLCDQDDVWKEVKIERIIDFFSDPNVLSLHSDIDIIGDNKELIRKNAIDYHERKKKMMLQDFFRHIYYCGMSTAFRKDLVPQLISIDPKRLPVHDWLVHAVAVCQYGMFTSSEVLAYRRFHEDNVALNLSKTKRKGINQRLEVVNYYCWHYELLKELANMVGTSRKDRVLIEKVLSTNLNRKEYLRKRSLLDAIKNVVNIKFYPTKQAFISDVLYLMKVF